MPRNKTIYQQLSFPLNVYATLLQLDDKPVDYLHFGLFQYPGEDVYSAQQHSTEKVLQHLPDAPGSVLEIGMGLGTLQKVLLEKGYQAQGLTPDQAQYDIALTTIGPQAHIHCSSFEDFSTNDHFNIIISQESAQYIDSLELLPKVALLLESGGHFILIDEVCLNPQQAGNEVLHNPEHLKFLAQSVGLTVQFEEDLTASAQYTMEYLQAKLAEHREVILQLIDNDHELLNQLVSDIARYIHHYQNQYYGYRLITFVKANDTLNSLHYLQQNHLTDFQKLFYDAFEQSMDTELWQWKYQPTQVPARSHSIGYWQGTQLTGHYGGLIRDILFFGQPQKAIQIGDTMVALEKRGTLTKNGIFHQLARIFLQRFIGYGSPYLLGFGFPNTRVMKLAETLGLYQSVGRITRLSWNEVNVKTNAFYKIRQVSEYDKAAIDSLWLQMADDSHEFIIGVRDWQQINYRYRQHPRENYLVLKLNHRLTNKLICVLVLKKEDLKYHLMDFVCIRKNIPLVLYAAIRYSQQHKQSELFTHISENMKPYFKTYPYREDDPQIQIPHSSCTPGPATDSINNKWWLMAGDSDFM